MPSPYKKEIQKEIEAAKIEAKKQSNDLWQGTRAILEDRTSRTNKMKILTIVAFVISVMAAIVSHVTNTPALIYAIIVIFVIMLGLWMQHDTKSLEHLDSIKKAADDLQNTVVHSKALW